MRVFRVKALMYGRMLVLETEDLFIVNVGKHYVSTLANGDRDDLSDSGLSLPALSTFFATH